MGIFGIDPTDEQIAQLQPFAAGVSPPGGGGMFGQAAGGGMTPWLRLALQTVAGGLAGSSARNFGQGVAIGAQYGQQAQETARRNRYVDEQTRYLQSRQDAEQRAAQQKQQQLESLRTMPAPAGVDPTQWANMVRINPDYALEIAYPKPQPPTSEVRNYEYGLTHPEFAAQQEKLRKAAAPSTSVVVGGTNVQMPYPLEKSVIANQQNQQFNESDQLASLRTIQSSFNPRWLQLGPRAGQALSSLKEFVGIPLSPDQQKDLTEYTQFRQNSVENFNKLVKSQTGTALSPGEAERITNQTPNAGTGIFDGDAPTPFKAKMDNGIRNLKLALMRRHFALKQGMDPLQTGIDLADVPKLIERRGAELEAGLRQQMPGITDEQLKMEVAARLRNEFGTGQ